MSDILSKCFKVSDYNLCPFCKSSNIIKNGKTKNKKQQYFCKQCTKRCIEYYTYKAYDSSINQQIVILTKEGLGIRSTARVLKISATTLLKRIVEIAKVIIPPVFSLGKVYEIDEINTFLKSKNNRLWIVYAIERCSKVVVNFTIGKRTSSTLNIVVDSLNTFQPIAIYSDKLRNYKYLINQSIHKVKRYGTNYIERKNLTLRTHIKRLNRKTICFSKKEAYLEAILKIYFWSKVKFI